MIQITLDEEVADALCCYLDEEDMFPAVIDALLKAIPVTAPTKPVEIHQLKPLELQYRRYSTSTAPRFFKEVLADHHEHFFVYKRAAVFQITIRPGEDAPQVVGFCDYATYDRRYYFEANREKNETIVGYYHPPTEALFAKNQSMIDFLVAYGYIEG